MALLVLFGACYEGLNGGFAILALFCHFRAFRACGHNVATFSANVAASFFFSMWPWWLARVRFPCHTLRVDIVYLWVGISVRPPSPTESYRFNSDL